MFVPVSYTHLGKVEGKIRVSYEDEAMQQKTEEIPISVEVMEAQNEQADVSENSEMARPRGTVLWPATVLAVLLATALFTAAKARKKIRDRKMEDAKRAVSYTHLQVTKEVLEAKQRKIIDDYIDKPVSASSILKAIRTIQTLN